MTEASSAAAAAGSRRDRGRRTGGRGRPPLSPALVYEFSRPDSLRVVLLFGLTLGGSFVLPAIPVWLGSWGWLIVTLPVMAGLQHTLLQMLHESMHRSLCAGTVANARCRLVLGCLTGHFLHYRGDHGLHHAQLGGDEDPEAHHYLPFPKGRVDLLGRVGCHLSGWAVIASAPRVLGDWWQVGTDRGALLAVQVGWAVCLCVVHGPVAYLSGWLLPLLTVTPTLVYIRSAVEHLDTVPSEPRLHRYRSVEVGWVERGLFAPLNFHLHAEHHFYPSVCFHNLPRVAELIRGSQAFRENVVVSRGYWRTLWQAHDVNRLPAARHDESFGNPK